MQTVRAQTTPQTMQPTTLPQSDIESKTADQIKELQKANRILQKKLSRSERTRAEMEQENQIRENMLKRLLLEAEAQSATLTEAKAAADNANSAKSEFLANMSHELRTPLNGILGYAQILKHSDDLSTENQQGVEVIYQCGSHLLTLINDILDLSKIEARRMDLNLTEFSLAAFLQGVAEMCQIRAAQKNIEFIYKADAPLPRAIGADEKRLRQVLINLLGNAIKFTDQGSVLFQVESVATSEHPCLRFSIRDTGVGMSAEQTQRIFQPFEQVGDKSRKSEGTGLGLAISTRIVKLMGSKLVVKSELGKGSHFSFDMAVGAIATLTEDELATGEFTNQSGRISGYMGTTRTLLIIDDRPENLSVLRNLLTPLGFNIIEAEDGQRGLEMAQTRYPDLIVTDIAMPKLDGLSLIETLRQLSDFADTPILASSASVFEADQRRSLAVGANDFLSKPVYEETLLRLLQKHLHLSWQRSEPNQYQLERSLASKEKGLSTSAPAPSTDELNSLYMFARQGDLDAVLVEAKTLQAHYPQFAQSVTAFAEGFQLKELLSLLEKHTQSQTGP